tara:strand:- start:811 stop:1299 length:489 start_codon:yes stop_codon:yes gene_type:complete
MAYQKLQVGLGVNVIPNDTLDIPNPSGYTLTGAVTSAPAATALIDTSATFLANNISAGMVVYNTSNNTVIAEIISVNSETSLTIAVRTATGGFTTGNTYTIYANTDNPGCVLYVGGAGDLRVLTSSGSDITFTGVLAGSFIPVQVKRVFATSNTASSILALW